MNTNRKFYMTFRGGNCVFILSANLRPKHIMPFFNYILELRFGVQLKLSHTLESSLLTLYIVPIILPCKSVKPIFNKPCLTSTVLDLPRILS